MSKMSRLYLDLQMEIEDLVELGFNKEEIIEIVSSKHNIPEQQLRNAYFEFNFPKADIDEILKTVSMQKAQHIAPEYIIPHVVLRHKCTVHLATSVVKYFKYIEAYHKVKMEETTKH